ncbi:unnamed protein product, partial [Brenthis ino]
MAHAVNQIPQLESGNFTNWLFRIEIAMDEKGCVDAIRKKTDLKDADLKKSDAKAHNIIVQALSDKHLEYVKESRTVYEMIENLRNVFERKTTISNLYSRRSLINLKCKRHDSVEEHFNKFDKIIREIESNGTKMTEKDKVCPLLISMQGAYPSIVTALETSNMELKIDFVKREENDSEKAISFIASQAYTAATYQNEIEFVIDSGASNHMISIEYEKYMTDIQEIQEIKVLVANGNMLSAKRKEKTENNLWHRRMGHLNYQGMKILGLPLSKERCTICMEAKGTRCSFSPTPIPRTKKIGELIYCDIGGPITPISKDGEKYYLTIIDDYSHFMEVNQIGTKSEAYDYDWILRLRLQTMESKTNEIIESRDVRFDESNYRYEENERISYIDYDENGESKTLTSKEPPSTSKEPEIEPSRSSKGHESSDDEENCNKK